MWEGGSLPYTTSEHCRSALVQPGHPYICEVDPFSVGKNRTVRTRGSCRVYDEYRLKNVIKEHENRPTPKRRQDFCYETEYYSLHFRALHPVSIDLQIFRGNIF